MNYHRVYDQLITRAKLRNQNVTEYYEVHHIVPRCMGGDNSATNLVELTGREHMVAHLCLVKMHSGNHMLVKAATMMTVGSSVHHRSKNRTYGWLRAKHSVAMSIAQAGSKNSQHGSTWIFNECEKRNKKIKVADIDNYIATGWCKGRVYDFTNIYQICACCNNKFISRTKKQTCSKKCDTKHTGKYKLLVGRENELISAYAETGSLNKALKIMGLPGAIGYHYHWAKTVIK